MFEEIPFLLGFIILSLIASTMIRYLPSPLNVIIFIFSVVGVILHELCHLILCLITRTPVEQVSLLHITHAKEPNSYAAGGEVRIKEQESISFLKAFLIGFAPSYLLFWAFWFLWDQIKNAGLDDLTIILYVLLMCSMILGAAPSFEDLKSIGRAFSRDLTHSLYQLSLILISTLIIVSIITNYQIQLAHEILFYLFVAFGYAILRYLFMGLRRLWQKPRFRKTPIHHYPNLTPNST